MDDAAILSSAATVLVVVVGALLTYLVVFRLAYRVGLRGATAQDLRAHVRWPARTVVALVAAMLAVPATDLRPALRGALTHALQVFLIVAVGWFLTRVIAVAERAAMRRFSIEMKDNLAARRKRTQAVVLSRVGAVAVVVLSLAAVMLTFEEARAVGASLLASAGVAGLVAGVAARSTLGNLVAGVQIAFTEPIRIDDVVVVEGEWGRIEEITLTYVVVRIWDARRLLLPTSYFVERPFQNWTRNNAQVLGAVHLFVDHTTPVEEVRAELGRILQRSEKWDGDAWVLQVVDATERTIELRALMTAEDAPTSWDLRCEVREELIAFLRDHHPGALPRVRLHEAEEPRAVATVDLEPDGHDGIAELDVTQRHSDHAEANRRMGDRGAG